MMVIGIKERRDSIGASRKQVAEAAGITAAQLWRVEDGRPHGDELARVSQALDKIERSKNGGPAETTVDDVLDILRKVIDRVTAARNARTIKDARAELDAAIEEATAAIKK